MKDKNKAAQGAARRYFDGYTCSEAILLSLREEGFLAFPDEIIKASTGFGAGVGLSRQMCGCLSGAVMAIGLKYGRTGPPTSRKAAWDRCRYLSKRFVDNFRTTSCADLTKAFADFSAHDRIKHCAAIIEWTTNQLVDVLMQKQDIFSSPEIDAYYNQRERRSQNEK